MSKVFQFITYKVINLILSKKLKVKSTENTQKLKRQFNSSLLLMIKSIT